MGKRKVADRTLDQFQGALLGGALGDALGTRLEAEPIRDRDRIATWIAESSSSIPNSPDTAMTIATAQTLIEAGGFFEDHMAKTLEVAFRATYGVPADLAVFDKPSESDEPDDEVEEATESAASFGNGAALRVAPIGLFYHRSPAIAADIAAQAAWITHAHPLGVDGAALQAAAVAEMFAEDELDPDSLLTRLRMRVRTRWFRENLEKWEQLSGSVATMARVLGNTAEAHRSVPTAVCCFLQNRSSFTDSLLFALSLGGDMSALASMTGTLAGARLGASAIPEAWIDRLDGHSELAGLAAKLLSATDTQA